MIWIIVIIAAAIIIKFFIFLKNRQDELEASFQQRFGGFKIQFMDKHALYIARESDGYSHFRGTGYLVLAKNELYFERLLKRKIIIIPTSSIITVEKTKKIAGQSPGMMLKVVFKTPEGEQDAVAWKVKELDRWIKEISAMIEENSR